MTMSPPEMERKLKQLDNDVQSIYELLSTIEGTQRRHGNRLGEIAADMTEKFGALDLRHDGVDTRLDNVDARLDNVDARLLRVDGRLERLEGRLERVDGRLEQVDGRLTGLDDKVVSIDTKLDTVIGLLQQGPPTPL